MRFNLIRRASHMLKHDLRVECAFFFLSFLDKDSVWDAFSLVVAEATPNLTAGSSS